jgi:hypothetical protein
MEKYKDTINELNKEFEAKNANSYYRITLEDKMKNIMKKIDEILRTKCPNEIQKVQSLMQENNVNGRIQMVPIQGKENELMNATQDLIKCQGSMLQLFTSIQGITKITETLISDELDLCVKDCFKIDNEENAKTCLKFCYHNTFNYTLTASQKMVEKTINTVEEQMKKL